MARKAWWGLAAAAGVLGASAVLVVAPRPPAAGVAPETGTTALAVPPVGWSTTRTGGWALEQASQACAFQEPYTLWARERSGAWRPIVRGPSACTPAGWQQGRLGPSGYPQALAIGPQGASLLAVWGPAAGYLRVVQVSTSGRITPVASVPALGPSLTRVHLGPGPRPGQWTLRYTIQDGASQATAGTITLIHTAGGTWHTVPQRQGAGEQLALPSGVVLTAGAAPGQWQGDAVSLQVVGTPAGHPYGTSLVGNHAEILQQGFRSVAGQRVYTALVKRTPAAAAASHQATYAWWVVQLRPLAGPPTAQDLAYAVVITVPAGDLAWPAWTSSALAHWRVGT